MTEIYLKVNFMQNTTAWVVFPSARGFINSLLSVFCNSGSQTGLCAVTLVLLSASCSLCDMWLLPKPGTFLALFAALAELGKACLIDNAL